MTTRQSIGLVVVLLAVTACSSGNDETIAAAKLPTLVLQPSDLPAEFMQFDEGRQGRADAPLGARADPQRFGRRGGWKARYRRAGTQVTSGPLVVESRADLFETAGGAKDDFAAYRAQLEREGDLVDGATVGDESVAAATTQEAFPADVRSYTVAWREANVTASVLVQGFEGKLSLDHALALARKQQKRLEAAKAR